MNTSRTLPHSVEDEEHLLACCFLDGQTVIPKCQEAGITPSSFYVLGNSVVFSTILDLFADQKPTDIDVVASQLKMTKRLEEVGGWSFLTQISQRVPTVLQAGHFIESVVTFSRLRAVIMASTEIVEAAYAFDGEFNDIDAALEKAIRSRGGVSEARSWQQAVREAEAITRERMKPPEQRNLNGQEVSWGLSDFDRYFGALEPGELVVIGGYTSSGKSSLLRQLLWGMAKAGAPTLINTLETRDTEEAVNLAILLSGIRGRSRLHELSKADQNLLIDAYSTLNIDHFSVCHQDQTLADICARARAFKRRHGLAILGIDYLQILTDVKKLRANERPDFAISCVTSELKRFATTEGTVNFLLSGFNRDYIRDRREPRLSDLDGSSSIEKDASRVILLHIPEEYQIGNAKFSQSPTADSSDQPNFYVKIIQAKGRNQGTSSIGLMFHRETKTFKQITR